MCWNLPEKDNGGIPLATPQDHIIYRGITVSYMQTSVIRCALDKSTVMDIETAFETYVSNLVFINLSWCACVHSDSLSFLLLLFCFISSAFWAEKWGCDLYISPLALSCCYFA